MGIVLKISPNPDEQRLVEYFLGTLGSEHFKYELRSALRCLLYEYRRMYPEQSLLTRIKETCWVKEWRHHYPAISNPTRRMRLYALQRFMQFLYDEKIIDHNIYELVEISAPEGHWEVAFVGTSFSIQRQIEAWLYELPEIGVQRQKLYRSLVLRFSIFPSADSCLWYSLERVREWLRSLASSIQPPYLNEHARVLNLFFTHLQTAGLIDENPIAQLLKAYPSRGLKGVVSALCSDKPEDALSMLAGRQPFRSYLARDFEKYLQLKRATGRIYDYEETMLLKLDSYLYDTKSYLTAESFHSWMQSLSHLHSTTQCHYYHQIRLFCIYLRRTEPDAFVPASSFDPLPTPRRLPVILSEREVSALIEATQTLPESNRCPLRRQSFRLIVTLLYCCGLRRGEVINLNLSDVDIENGVLSINNTKFFKSRLVPMATPVTKMVAEYIEERNALGILCQSDDPLFYSWRKRRYFKNSVLQVFKQLLRCLPMDGGMGERRIRVHDLRHTFAVHRLTKWYRDGEDVQAKLSILSQYMGHAEVQDTVRYLSLVPELCEAAMDRFHTYAIPLRRTSYEQV